MDLSPWSESVQVNSSAQAEFIKCFERSEYKVLALACGNRSFWLAVGCGFQQVLEECENKSIACHIACDSNCSQVTGVQGGRSFLSWPAAMCTEERIDRSSTGSCKARRPHRTKTHRSKLTHLTSTHVCPDLKIMSPDQFHTQ